jgi:hypothetical protein
MDLSFGTNVREHGYSIGRLAGIEVDKRTRAVRNIVISPSGTGDAKAERRVLADVPADHFDGDIVLRGFPGAEDTVTPPEMLLLNDSTKVVRGERQIGWLSGVELSPESGEIVSITGQPHWWSRRFHLKANELDFSVPGEVRVSAASTQAA